MKFKIERSFERDFKKLRNKNLAQSILDAINNVDSAKSIEGICNLKKLTGHKTAFRIRSGDYRIGVFIEANVVIFAAFDHRKDIYKRFP
jgi:mRNA interferase RelE/StbE